MLSLITILLGLIAGNNGFETHLKKYLDEKLKSYEKYEYQIMRLPVSYARIEINEEKEFRLNKNFAYIPIRIFDHKSQVSSSIITISLKLYRPVFIARKKVGAKENLSSSMFERKLADVGSIEERVFEDFDGLSSYRSKILIKEGMILSKEMVEMIPLIF